MKKITMSVLVLLAGFIAAASAASAETPVQTSPDAVPAKTASSDSLPVSLDAVSSDMPELQPIYKTLIKRLSHGNPQKADEMTANISGILAEGKDGAAASALGAAASAEAKDPKYGLGVICAEDIREAGASAEEQVKFLQSFVKGYKSTSVLVFTKNGIAKYRAYGKRRGAQWKKLAHGALPSEPTDRIYESEKLVFIPFKSGDVFKLDVSGKADGTLKMWKVMPGGTNAKSWPGGAWEREITVRGDKLY